MLRAIRKLRQLRPFRKKGVLDEFKPMDEMAEMKKPEASPETAIMDLEESKDNGL
jgi:hypothetical protein